MKILFSSLRFAFATAGIFLVAGGINLVQAQGPGSGGPVPEPTAVPIDGGASLLLAAGVGFGLKKLREHRKR
ncbi:PID-CTERM protein-sorting domain-containing protein [Hymenobacter canadensis]|uniref:VPDSG-CTERM protein sorting domain-containing protein n=1 Tax=Hymenobacter canadensis TaxID=2999067 RepID=A0ABY7LU75_9BACT|nr:hypothetical protein [Hymenobacter canadensis]WBA43482.1 hypothetical protein O3303_07910 [Hymenobacter canadensis]